MSAVQLAKTSAKAYYHRFLGLGLARILLVLAVLFTIVSIANPIWAFTDGTGGTYDTRTFDWTTTTNVAYHNGVWTETRIQSYSPNGFDAPMLANAVGGSYLLQLVFLIALIGAVALFSLKWIDHWPSVGLLIVGLLVVVFAFVALLYPVFTVPAAAATDLGEPAITGYWGAAAPLSWGAALGWWSLLLAVLLGIIGGVWPFLKSMRQPRMVPPPPREWQIER